MLSSFYGWAEQSIVNILTVGPPIVDLPRAINVVSKWERAWPSMDGCTSCEWCSTPCPKGGMINQPKSETVPRRRTSCVPILGPRPCPTVLQWGKCISSRDKIETCNARRSYHRHPDGRSTGRRICCGGVSPRALNRISFLRFKNGSIQLW